LTYLQTIYEMHGDWPLALASYNWGEGSVKRAIERNQAAGLPTDYLSLPMPEETRNYVPKLQALKNIVASPQTFGVTLPRIVNEPYFVAVQRSRDIDVRTAARLANMSIEDFRALNPSFNRPVITGASSTLLVPTDRAKEFKSGLESQGQLATWQAHTVQRKETIEHIAAQYGMTVAALREVNGLAPRARLRPGQGLLVQKKGPGDVELRFASFTPPDGLGLIGTAEGPATYRVRRGDTLASVAHRFGMKPAELTSMNHLKGDRVSLGQQLHVRQAAVKLVQVKSTVPAKTGAKHSGKLPVAAKRTTTGKVVRSH
jgi:membrane-bound lytic murein transglycosylase D